MGEAELQSHRNLLIIHAELIFYGDAASEELSIQIAKDVEDHWNEPGGEISISQNWFFKKRCQVRFNIKGTYNKTLTPETVFENTDPRKNYFRIEEFATGNISFVDGLNSNTGYFKLENLLNNSSTAAHEFGHTLGLDHPHDLDIRGRGTPGIMYPRGTLVDPQFQYYPEVAAGEKGGTLNPFTRKVLQHDIDDLQLNRLDFNAKGLAVVGGFTSIWHEKHKPDSP
ncbi:MAG TPA: peptidase M10 [Ferruginibacter sp.]|nr:peptidase M10 [Ferruginibacter sp.]